MPKYSGGIPPDLLQAWKEEKRCREKNAEEYNELKEYYEILKDKYNRNRDELGNKTKDYLKMMNQLESTQTNLFAVTTENARLLKENGRLQDDLKRADATNKGDPNINLTSLNETVTFLRTQTVEQENKIKTLDKEVQRVIELKEEMEQSETKRTKQILELQSQVAEKNKEIDRLRELCKHQVKQFGLAPLLYKFVVV
jgi:hypothetical protein